MRYTETFCTIFAVFLKILNYFQIKRLLLFKKKVVLKSSDSGLAEWGLNRLTTLQITVVNSKQNTNSNKPPEGPEKWAKIGTFWRRNEPWNEAATLGEFPVFKALAWGQAAVTWWCRKTKPTKSHSLSGLKPKYRVWVSHHHRNVREEISERGVSEKRSSRIFV